MKRLCLGIGSLVLIALTALCLAPSASAQTVAATPTVAATSTTAATAPATTAPSVGATATTSAAASSLPATGSGPGAASNGMAVWALIGAAALVLLLGGFTMRRQRR